MHSEYMYRSTRVQETNSSIVDVHCSDERSWFTLAIDLYSLAKPRVPYTCSSPCSLHLFLTLSRVLYTCSSLLPVFPTPVPHPSRVLYTSSLLLPMFPRPAPHPSLCSLRQFLTPSHVPYTCSSPLPVFPTPVPHPSPCSLHLFLTFPCVSYTRSSSLSVFHTPVPHPSPCSLHPFLTPPLPPERSPDCPKRFVRVSSFVCTLCEKMCVK